MKFIKKLLNSQPTISFATFRDMNIVISNKKFNNFFGVSASEIENNKINAQTYLPVLNDVWIDERLAEPEKPFTLKITKNEEDFYLNIHLAITYLNEECLYIYTIIDITELERLKEKELFRSKIASIGELSLGLTHEINTPLTYIKGNMELMEMDLISVQNRELQGYFQENIDAVKNGVERINSIVELLKEYSVEKEVFSEDINVYEVIQESFKLINSRAQYISNIYFNGKELIPNRILTSEKFFINTISKVKLQQLILIILNNAIDELAYSKLDFLDKFIKIKVNKIENQKIMISIEDNGGGINEDIKSTIFEAFVSGKSHSGMGLGLNLAKKMVEDSNGSIRAVNTENGAIFRIIL